MTEYEELEVLRHELEESKRMIESLEYDELTGLLIRQAFLQRATREIKAHPDKIYGVLALDFENFKSSNTLYGEDRCNEFLAYVAKRMREALPHSLIGRFGGDQFVILFDTEKNYMALLESYKNSILQSSPIPNQVVKFGIYTPIDRSLLFVCCCDRAFLAIHKIKGTYGQNVAFYEDSMQQQFLEEQKIVESMEQAIEQGQFQVYYQPKHETVTERIAGAEALVRWWHPVYGFMSPGQFIPLFERNGFITKLDSFVIERVCQDMKRWKEQNIPMFPISVNISRRDYLEPGCIEHQLELIEKYNIDHSLIHMEVTESMYADNTNLIVTKVRDTQDLGFLIEMDDFGSGYSSLGLLSSFPLDVLKLDISFVRNIDVNKIVIENIIKMSHRMGLSVVAEGVETEKQYKILSGLGCDLIQGFYFSKPLPINEFEEYIRHYTVLTQIKRGSDVLTNVGQTTDEQMLVLATEVSEGIPGGFFSCHLDDNLELMSVNKEMLSIFECETVEELREFSKNSGANLIHPDDFENAIVYLESQLANDNSLYSLEHRILTKKGNVKYVNDYGRIIKTKKYGDLLFVFLYDVTEQLLREKESLKEKEENANLQNENEIAKQSNNAKILFMKNLSEELLPVITDLIKQTKCSKENIDVKDKLKDSIEEELKIEERFLAIFNHIQEFIMQEDGVIKLEEVPTDISAAMERVYNFIKVDAEKKGIKVEYWSKIYNPYIYQDVKHTADVVVNIIHNAIKYTPAGGTITFGLEQLPNFSNDGCNIKFVCEDTGIGMAQEFLPHAFEQFSREDNEINKAIPSAGLGLSMAQNLLKVMYGTITVKSLKGKGTKVETVQPHRFAKKEDIITEATFTAKIEESEQKNN